MKKIKSIILCLVIIFAFCICAFLDNKENVNKNTIEYTKYTAIQDIESKI